MVIELRSLKEITCAYRFANITRKQDSLPAKSIFYSPVWGGGMSIHLSVSLNSKEAAAKNFVETESRLDKVIKYPIISVRF